MIKKIIFIIFVTLLYLAMTKADDRTTLLEVVIPFSEELQTALQEQYDAFQLKYPNYLEITPNNPTIRLLLIGRVLDSRVNEYERAIAEVLRRKAAFIIPFSQALCWQEISLIKNHPLTVALTYQEPIKLTKLAEDLRAELNHRKLPYRGLLFSGKITIGTASDQRTVTLLNEEITLPKTDFLVDNLYLVKNNRYSNRYWLKH